MPEGTDNLPSLSFTEALSAAFSEKLAVLLKNDDAVAGVMSCMSNIKLDAAIDIANTGRPLVMDDFISPSACLASCAAKARTGQAERSVAKDICRMGNSNVLGQPAFAGARFHTPEGDVTIPFGREAKETFPFRNSADKANFTSGSPSGYTRHLLDTCRNICERREEQAQSLLSLFNQTPLRAWAAQGGTGAPGTLISNGLNEHMATAYDVSRQADGSIRLDMHSNEAAETAGRGSMTVIIGTDGSMTMESCTLESAENMQEQNLRDIVADMVAAPELSANGKSALCRLVSDSLVLDGLHRQDPGTWPSAVQTRLTEFQQHSGVMASLRTLPQDMDAQAIRTVRNELENSIRSYYRHSFRQMDQDGIFPSYIKDALRHSVSGINGEPLRLIPAGHAAPAALDPQSGLPVEAVRREALREQLMEAIPDRTLRGFASQVACQAGLEGSLTMHLLGVEPDNSTPLWPGYVSTMDLNARSAEGVVNHSYPKHTYTITTDAPIPGRTLDDPMNEDRGIHIRLDITQALELAYSNNKLTADLTRFALIVDIPFHQPPRAEGEPPAFTISTLEYHPA